MEKTHMAAPELAAVEVDGMSRSSFLLRSALTTGAMVGGSALTPFVGRALAQDGGGDIEILNFALTLEQLETTFYDRALGKGRNLGSEVRTLAEELRDNEQAHVDALTATIKDLGGMPGQAPTVGFGDVFTNRDKFLKIAQSDRGPRRQRLQRRRADDLLDQGARRRRRHRPGRGAPRRPDPPAPRASRRRRRRSTPRWTRTRSSRPPPRSSADPSRKELTCPPSVPWSSSSSWPSR